MSNPVIQALVDAKVRERLHELEAASERALSERLNLPATPTGDASDWEVFVHWTVQRNLVPFPARPATVALFVVENASMGIDRLLRVIEAISIAHVNAGTADPTLGPMVALALDQVSPVTPPRSRPKEDKLAFLQLPRKLQHRVLEREEVREKELRRGQNQAAEARKALAAIQQSKEKSDGTQSQPAAA